MKKLRTIFYALLFDVTFQKVASISPAKTEYYIHFHPRLVPSVIWFIIKLPYIILLGGYIMVKQTYLASFKSFKGGKISLPNKEKPTKKHLFKI